MTARALSLTRPWPFVIVHLGKRVENRSRRDGREPSVVRYRGPLYLHAAKSWDPDVGEMLYDNEMVDPATALHLADKTKHPAGVIVARCRAVGSVRAMPDGSGRFEEYAFDGLHRPDELDMRWWHGGYALVLADVEPLREPVPCRGALGVWRVPEDVERQLRAGTLTP